MEEVNQKLASALRVVLVTVAILFVALPIAIAAGLRINGDGNASRKGYRTLSLLASSLCRRRMSGALSLGRARRIVQSLFRGKNVLTSATALGYNPCPIHGIADAEKLLYELRIRESAGISRFYLLHSRMFNCDTNVAGVLADR